MAPPDDNHDCGWKKYAAAQAQSLQALQDQLAAMSLEIATLKEQAAAAKRARFGKKTEKLAIERLPPPVAVKKSREEITNERRERALERSMTCETEEEVIPLGDQACRCGKCGGDHLTHLKGNSSVRYEYVAEHFRKRVFHRETVSCLDCGHIAKALAPVSFGEKSKYAPSVVAHLIYAKWVTSMPQHRLQKAYEAIGIPMARSTTCDLTHRAADELSGLYERLLILVREAPDVHADETTIKQWDRDAKSYIWVFRTPSIIAYRYAATRSGVVPYDVLGDSEGTVVVDQYTGYNLVTTTGKRQRGGCMAHARRTLFEQKQFPEVIEALDLISEIYRVECEAKQAGITGEDLRERRQLESRPLMAKLLAWVRRYRPVHEPRSGLGKAIHYILRARKALCLFLDNPSIPPENNPAEQSLRRIAVGRGAYLFVGNERTGRNHAILYSLAATCELHGVNPRVYLEDVLLRVQTHPAARIDELLPQNWKPLRRA